VNYQQTIDFLFSQLPMFSRIGSAAYKKDLTNIILLCKKLGDPQEKFRTIHIGGTNGKGSVSHMLTSILHQAGYKTGLYTSPHVYDFRERIRIGCEMIEESFVVDFVEKIKDDILTIQPSFFEITVAMAFEYFAFKKVDVAIIEVGLGGRLDSTNIIQPELSVITNIGWDHANMLGDTLQKIAAEKAGIIKKDIPVVIGERKEETSEVFIKAAELNHSSIVFASDHYEVKDHQWKNDLLEVEIMKDKKETISFELDLPGIYQLKNICTVLQSVEVLTNSGWKISNEHLTCGLSHAKKITGLHGRWELIRKEPDVVLEVAHNKDGVQQMVLHLQKLNYQKLHIVFGMVKDKDINDVLQFLPKQAEYYFTQASIPRAIPFEELKLLGEAQGLYGNAYANVDHALNDAISKAGIQDLILVCGSIFLVAEVNKNLLLVNN
jgi:dihydrofolate synthase / folylpolyglutamate synthase